MITRTTMWLSALMAAATMLIAAAACGSSEPATETAEETVTTTITRTGPGTPQPTPLPGVTRVFITPTLQAWEIEGTQEAQEASGPEPGVVSFLWERGTSPVLTAITATGFKEEAIICVLTKEGTVVCRTLDDRENPEFPAYQGNFTKILEPNKGMAQLICGLTEKGHKLCGFWHQQETMLERSNSHGLSKSQYKDLSSNGNTRRCWLHMDNSASCVAPGLEFEAEGPFTQVASGNTYGCALRSNGSIHCEGQVSESAMKEVEDERFSTISSKHGDTCGIRTNGTVICWTPEGLTNPIKNQPEGQYTSITTGSGFACGIDKNSHLDCWGSKLNIATEDELWCLTADQETRDIDVCKEEDRQPFIYSQCSLEKDGAIRCIDYGTAERTFPNPLLDVPPGEYKDIATLHHHTACAITTEDRVICWGLINGEIEF